MRAVTENTISPDYICCYLPRVLEIFGKTNGILDYFENFGIMSGNFGFFFLNFQSRIQIMTPRGLYDGETADINGVGGRSLVFSSSSFCFFFSLSSFFFASFSSSSSSSSTAVTALNNCQRSPFVSNFNRITPQCTSLQQNRCTSLQQNHTTMYQPSTESHQTLLPSILRRSFSKQDWRWSRVELLGQCIIGVLEDCTRITAHSEQLAVNEGRKLILHPNFIQHPSTLLLDAFLIWKLKLVKGA